MSERRASAVIRIHRSTCRYESRRPDDGELLAKIKAIAGRKPRYGYRRIHGILVKSEEGVNHKRTYRLYRSAALQVRRRARRWPHARAMASTLQCGVCGPL